AGIGRYITHLVRELLALAPRSFRWTLLVTTRSQLSEILGQNRKRYGSVESVLVPVKHYTIQEQLSLLPILWRLKPDIFHVPHFNTPLLYTGTTIVTIHDLLWHERKGPSVTTLPIWQYWTKYLFYRLVVRQSISHASKVLVPTKLVQAAVISHYPKANNKIIVTPEGVSQAFLSQKERVFNWSKRKLNGLLYVGSLYPHKNIALVLSALKELPELKIKLVSSRSIFLKRTLDLAQSLGVTDQVKILSNLTDAELAREYTESLALVQPSHSEGFGLTGIEAMACGTPVLCSNIPVFREVYKDHAFYFDPHSTESFRNACAQLQKATVPNKIAAARAYSNHFTWKSTAEKTLEVYTSLTE
ncbi:glycosyltransferase family 4 protein, partial [Candidatus Woesebacteria bacterium]|nr:glycosyltransferase family 4 protein [Candidatus Woesebacteria bacterium]